MTFKMAVIRLLEFSKFRACVMRPLSPCYSASVLNFTEIGLSAAELCTQKTIFKMAAVILNFKNVHIPSSGCHRVPNVLMCTKFHQNETILVEIWRFNDLRYGGRPPY